ncbi:MAG: hypothetical protein ACE5KI_06875, partial [Dehalococcoidia bacterium]
HRGRRTVAGGLFVFCIVRPSPRRVKGCEDYFTEGFEEGQMKTSEIREVIGQLSEEERRALIVELIPEFVKQLRGDPLFREEFFGMLRAKTVSQGQVILASATKKVANARRAIKENLLA